MKLAFPFSKSGGPGEKTRTGRKHAVAAGATLLLHAAALFFLLHDAPRSENLSAPPSFSVDLIMPGAPESTAQAATTSPPVLRTPNVAISPVAVTFAPEAPQRSAFGAILAGTDEAMEDKDAATNAFLSALMNHLGTYKRYPHVSRRNHDQGVTLVQFTMDDRGEVLKVRIAESSGHRLLDEECLALFARASPLPPAPRVLGDPPYTLTIPIAFSLR